MPSSIAFRCAGSSTTCMCEHGMNQALRPPECMSITTSASGNRTRVRKSASCSFGGPVRAARERAVEVRAGGPVARVRLGRGGREDRDDDHAARAPCSGCSSCSSRIAATWPSYSSPWLPARTSTVGPSPRRDRGDVDERARPAGGVRDLREREVPDLLAGRGEVDAAGDRRVGHARVSRWRATAPSVASSSRSTSSSTCAYEKWLRFRLRGSSKIPSFISSRR